MLLQAVRGQWPYILEGGGGGKGEGMSTQRRRKKRISKF
jgi:hypothetical protein